MAKKEITINDMKKMVASGKFSKAVVSHPTRWEDRGLKHTVTFKTSETFKV